jgi:hypothetical protein
VSHLYLWVVPFLGNDCSGSGLGRLSLEFLEVREVPV